MGRPSLRQLVIWFLAPSLLVGVAGVHAYLTTAKHQTPWEGGGFGMFSTVDKRQARFVRCSLVTSADTVRVQLPDHLDLYAERLRARPTSTRVSSLAQYLADATWVKAGAKANSKEMSQNSDGGPSPRYQFLPSYESSEQPRAVVRAVRVEVWRYWFKRRPYGLDADRLQAATRRPAVGASVE